jgi:hypothetical protein
MKTFSRRLGSTKNENEDGLTRISHLSRGIVFSFGKWEEIFPEVLSVCRECVATGGVWKADT